jgi:hypothetical protein
MPSSRENGSCSCIKFNKVKVFDGGEMLEFDVDETTPKISLAQSHAPGNLERKKSCCSKRKL